MDNVDELYSNLNRLLKDICSFLSNEGNYDKLSYQARQQADELINRSKKQLQEIAKIAVDDDANGAYVDMERKSSEGNDIYSSLDDTPVTKPQTQIQINPYSNLPAKDICQDIKYGVLSWKCKIILKFEKFRRIYAAVHNNWLLIYSSEKDSKPMQTFDLKFHKAKAVTAKQNKTPPQDFELVCLVGDSKTYYFLALTHKDMLQWTAQINRCHEALNKTDDVSEIYDEIANTNHKDDEENEDEEDIYLDLDTYSPNDPPQITVTKSEPPGLPARRCIKSNVPLPPVPKQESTESLSDKEQSQSNVSSESTSSFSSDDGDSIYQEFLAPTPERKRSPLPVIKAPVSGDEIYENSAPIKEPEIKKPKTPAKPKIILPTRRKLT